MERLMTIREAAKYLNIHPVTLSLWAKKRRIPGFKVGKIWRFRKEKVDAWLEKQENLKLKR